MQGNGLQVPPSSSARGEAGAAVLVEGVGVIAAWQGRLRLLAPQTSSPGDLMLVWGGAGAEVRGWQCQAPWCTGQTVPVSVSVLLRLGLDRPLPLGPGLPPVCTPPCPRALPKQHRGGWCCAHPRDAV